MQTETAFLEPGATPVVYRLRRSARRRRTMEVSVDSAGELSVAVPLRTAAAEIDSFLQRKAGWIRKQLADHQNGARRLPQRTFLSGETVPYLGRDLLLSVVESDAATRASVRLVGDRLLVRVPERHGIDRRAEAGGALERWYRARLRTAALERIAHFAPRIGVRPGRVVVKAQRTRWGSCGKDGTLRFNWCLALAPPEVIDYIVVHELCHLRRAGHGRMFWRLVATTLPDYNGPRALLHRDGWRYRL